MADKSRIEWKSESWTDPTETKRLRGLIERRQKAYLWGQLHWITPRLHPKMFDDGRQLLAISPIMYRPNRFVVRIGSSWSTSNFDRGHPMMPADWLDEVMQDIADEFLFWPWAKDYGLRDELLDGTDDDEYSAEIDWCDGCEWWEMKWPYEIPRRAGARNGRGEGRRRRRGKSGAFRDS